MAATKLTLRLDEDIIQKGKKLVIRNGTSLSKLFEDYLKELIQSESRKRPIVLDQDFLDQIVVCKTPTKAPEDYKQDYAEYAEYVTNKGRRSEEE